MNYTKTIREDLLEMARKGLLRHPGAMPSSRELGASAVRGTVKETVRNEYVSELDGPLMEAIAYLQDCLEAVPETLRSSAVMDIDVVDEYSASFTVTYKRPETDEEWAARREDMECRLACATAATEKREREELARLQAKYAAGVRP